MCWGPTILCKMFSKPYRDDRVGDIVEVPLMNLRKVSANVFGKRAVDGYMDHAVGWMPETLAIGLCFALTQEGGWVAGLHVDAYHLAVS